MRLDICYYLSSDFAGKTLWKAPAVLAQHLAKYNHTDFGHLSDEMQHTWPTDALTGIHGCNWLEAWRQWS